MTADEIIEGARSLDPSFTQQRHPRKVAIQHLSRVQRRLVAEWVKLEETAYVEIVTATFPLADFDAGVELLEDEPESGESVAEPIAMTAIQRPLDMWIRNEDKPVDLDLIRWGDRNRRVQGRAAYIVENTLFFTGRAEDWTDVERVELTYTPTPGNITDPAAELILPITAEELLVSSLGAFFARRSNDKELARPRREYIAEALDAEQLWLDEIRRREGATISRTRAAW
jgi:hypothetical protein